MKAREGEAFNEDVEDLMFGVRFLKEKKRRKKLKEKMKERITLAKSKASPIYED
jgi:hypothetical protein